MLVEEIDQRQASDPDVDAVLGIRGLIGFTDKESSTLKARIIIEYKDRLYITTSNEFPDDFGEAVPIESEKLHGVCMQLPIDLQYIKSIFAKHATQLL